MTLTFDISTSKWGQWSPVSYGLPFSALISLFHHQMVATSTHFHNALNFFGLRSDTDRERDRRTDNQPLTDRQTTAICALCLNLLGRDILSKTSNTKLMHIFSFPCRNIHASCQSCPLWRCLLFDGLVKIVLRD